MRHFAWIYMRRIQEISRRGSGLRQAVAPPGGQKGDAAADAATTRTEGRDAMSRHHTTASAQPAKGLRIFRTIAAWHARASERHALAAMGHRELRDIGLSPGEALDEARKPFWAA
jgi:uncharacterized protein YjiS (DUF1127 family)